MFADGKHLYVCVYIFVFFSLSNIPRVPGGSRRYDRELPGDARALATDRRQSGRSTADVEQTYFRAIAVFPFTVLQLLGAILRLGPIVLSLARLFRLSFAILLVNRILQVQLLCGRPKILGVLLVAEGELATGRRLRT